MPTGKLVNVFQLCFNNSYLMFFLIHHRKVTNFMLLTLRSSSATNRRNDMMVMSENERKGFEKIGSNDNHIINSNNNYFMISFDLKLNEMPLPYTEYRTR